MKIRNFSLKRKFTDYSLIQSTVASIVRNRNFHVKKEKLKHKDYLDIGCGPNIHENFINVDYWWTPQLDICWDISKGIPLESESVKGVFTEHCLEHISLESADHLISDLWRVLKPGGEVRIIVPDGQLYLTRYHEISQGENGEALPYAQSDVYRNIYSPMMSVNRIFRAHGHMFIYDFETLSLLLKKNGYIDIKRQSFQVGRNPDLLIDTESRAIESLYVEARKPSL